MIEGLRMEGGILPLTLFVVLLAAPSHARAQETGEPVVEEQVTLDAGGTLLRMDAELARRLGLFADVEGLREALLFRGPAGYTLEITARRNGTLVRERRPLTVAEAAAFQERVGALLLARGAGVGRDQAGRYLLLGTSTAAGLAFYGWAVPSIFDVDSTRGQVALYMLVSAGSILGPWLWSDDRAVTYGMSNAALWGASRGALHGLALHRLLEGADPPEFSCPDATPECFEEAARDQDAWKRRRLATALALSVAEGVGALAWAKHDNASAGDAHLVGVASDFGAGWGIGLATLLGAEEDGTGVAAAGLAGAAAGLAGGLLLADRRNYGWGDVEVRRAGGLVGGYGGAVLADVAGSDEPELFAGLAVAGSVAGLALTERLLGEREFTAGEGMLVDLGTAAGGLLGLGLAFLATDGGDPTPVLALSALGAGAGFGLT
ncbi:MAG TPA: hypothetical protein VK966_02610, partial [Longimicrobiales bacterium]|nr:hypothetical protein [Longimicrobiales bacterium]